MLTPLSAQQTIDRAKAALRSGSAVGLPELLALLETLSNDYFKVNLDEVSVIIERDSAVLARVIAVANTLAHNPGFTPIATINQAIHLVGFKRLRSLAVSLMLLETSARPRNPREQREAAAEALCAGLFAQSCAEHLGTIDPDVAFAAASLRHFGFILLPAVSLEHTQEAHRLLKSGSPKTIYAKLFGVTPLELSREVLASVRLPDDLRRALREVSGGEAGEDPSSLVARLTAVAELGGRMAAHALNVAHSSAEFLQHSHRAAQRFQWLLPAATECVEPALFQTSDRLDGFLLASGADCLRTESLRRIRAHVQHVVQARQSRVRQEAGENSSETNAAAEGLPSAALVEVQGPLLPDAGEEDPRDLPAAPEPAEVPRTAATWAERLAVVREEVQADEVWLFRRREGAAVLEIVGGVGTHWKNVRVAATIRAKERSVFGIGLSRRQVVLLHDTHDPTTALYLPDWWKAAPGMPRAFALVPMGGGVAVSELALLAWQAPRQVNVSRAQLEFIHKACAGQVAAPVNSDRAWVA